MKKLTFTLFSLFLGLAVLQAQTVPQGMKYQAVARDLDGNVIANSAVSIKIGLTGAPEDNTRHYDEVHRVTTNDMGLFSITIGSGKVLNGEFLSIPWSTDRIWIEIALDPRGGEAFEVVSTTQLLSVPYAFHAETAGKIAGEDADEPGEDERSLYWGTFGNANTFPPYSFIGTTDNKQLIFKTNNAKAMEIEADGDIVMENDLEVEGTLNADAIEADGLVVEGSGEVGPNGDHIAYFRNTEGGNSDGIAIKIDARTSTNNNFVTFYNNSLGGTNASPNVAGRIEGFDWIGNGGSEVFTPFPNVSFGDFFNIFDFNSAFDWGSFPTINLDPGSWNFDPGSISYDPPVDLNVSLPSLDVTLPDIDISGGSLPSFDPSAFFNPTAASGFANNLNNVVCWALENGLEGLITTNPFDLILAAGIVAATQNCTDGGVIYGATGADYAEWLEKENPDEAFVEGQIVGVFGGKISKRTEGADQIMSISMNPIVLGNMPQDGDRHKYEKVGFMGQVPVLVKGAVEKGDYILASGNNDGFGVAIRPGELQLEHMDRVLGRSWEDGSNYNMNMVNVSVGVKTNEWADLFERQKEELNKLERQMEELKDYDKLEDRLERVEALLNIKKSKK